MSNELNILLNFFKEISAIPRNSGKEEKIADYLEKFAKDRTLECSRDVYNNVLIKKKGTKKHNKTLILQAHTDMVCVKTDDSKHDFDKDPIEIIQDGDIIKANKTSLGGDDGIGVSFILFILDSKDLEHPNLECLFTTEEETNFNGASKFDYNKLTGNALINFDNDKDDTIVIGCAGDIASEYIFKGRKERISLSAYRLKISELKGGNSGAQVDKNRTNAITLIAKIIDNLRQYENVYINIINGGTSETDIANYAECIFNTGINNVEEKIKTYIEEYPFRDETPYLEILNTDNDTIFSLEDSNNIINEIIGLSKGIITKDDKQVITSENIGVIKTENDSITIKHILRSKDENELLKHNKDNSELSKQYNFSANIIYTDNAWRAQEESELKDLYKNAFYTVNQKYPEIKRIQAGIECSIFSRKKKDLDIISIGTIIENIHSINERIYVSSCKQTLQTLIEFMKMY